MTTALEGFSKNPTDISEVIWKEEIWKFSVESGEDQIGLGSILGKEFGSFQKLFKKGFLKSFKTNLFSKSI